MSCVLPCFIVYAVCRYVPYCVVVCLGVSWSALASGHLSRCVRGAYVVVHVVYTWYVRGVSRILAVNTATWQRSPRRNLGVLQVAWESNPQSLPVTAFTAKVTSYHVHHLSRTPHLQNININIACRLDQLYAKRRFNFLLLTKHKCGIEPMMLSLSLTLRATITEKTSSSFQV